MQRSLVLLCRFWRREQGIALMEFALVLPFLLLLMLGGIELTRFMLISQKVDKASYALADITNQYPPATKDRTPGEISVAQMNDVVFEQFKMLMEPYDVSGHGSVTITSVVKEAGEARIKWQVSGGGDYSGTGTESALSGMNPSTVNSSGPSLKNRIVTADASISTGIAAMDEGENMIVSEIYYFYKPLASDILEGLSFSVDLGETLLVRRSFTNPRIGEMHCLPETFVYPECT